MLNIATTAKNWFGSANSALSTTTATTPRPHPVVPGKAQPAAKGAMSQPRPQNQIEAEQAQMVQAVPTGANGFLQSEAHLAEAGLIARAQVGDQAAFARLVELHQDFVFNLAYRILQNYEEADDATQEAFVRIWQALPGFRGEAKFTTWAYRIVRNGCLNRLRSTKSAPRTISVENSFDASEDEGLDILTNLPGEHSDEPAWQFDTNERRQLIWQAVDTLPLKYREIIGLYYGQELSYEEIAALLEVPVGTVKTHLFRAKAQLKNRLLDLKEQGAVDFGSEA